MGNPLRAARLEEGGLGLVVEEAEGDLEVVSLCSLDKVAIIIFYWVSILLQLLLSCVCRW